MRMIYYSMADDGAEKFSPFKVSNYIKSDNYNNDLLTFESLLGNIAQAVGKKTDFQGLLGENC